ncbi:MAG: NUDIX domain-containing protein [Flavobacteriia bacterium]|nr:NUDIX domain-containing protein [Flavobacteriia bacterium]
MYKVFSQNHEITFLKELKKTKNPTILMSVEIALIHQNELIDRLLTTGDALKYTIYSNSPEESFLLFFSTILKIEAAGGLVKRKKSYLFIFRKNHWDLPKGKIEIDEKPKKAAAREIEEECGIYGLKQNKILCETYHLYNDYGETTLKKTYWYLFHYKGSKELSPQIEEDILQAEWKKENEIHELILKNTYPSIIEVWNSYNEIKKE